MWIIAFERYLISKIAGHCRYAMNELQHAGLSVYIFFFLLFFSLFQCTLHLYINTKAKLIDCAHNPPPAFALRYYCLYQCYIWYQYSVPHRFVLHKHPLIFFIPIFTRPTLFLSFSFILYFYIKTHIFIFYIFTPV